jgi:hypothetical protein
MSRRDGLVMMIGLVLRVCVAVSTAPYTPGCALESCLGYGQFDENIYAKSSVRVSSAGNQRGGTRRVTGQLDKPSKGFAS